MDAARLLDRLNDDAVFFMSSPERTMLASGVAAAVDVSALRGGGDVLSERVAELLKDARKDGEAGSRPYVVGAVPFDVTGSIRLTVPKQVMFAGNLLSRRSRETSASAGERPIGAVRLLEAIPDATAYRRGVRESLNRMAHGGLRKVVLSRCMRVMVDSAIDVRQLVGRMVRVGGNGYVFAVALEPGLLVGISPELLVAKRGRNIVAHPLAGSRQRGGTPAEDERCAKELLVSAKDRREHELVVEEVARTLRPLCRWLSVPAEPSLVATPTLWHLGTRMEGELIDPSISSLAIALRLHPTPAVCGSPRERALAVIREIEPYDRGYYTGAVGWCDADGDGEWVVAIRCAEIIGQQIRLFAGAGIVMGSREDDEWKETEAKLHTMFQAFGLEGGL